MALDDLKNARLLARALDKSGYYTVLSEVHHLVSQPGLLESTKKVVGVNEEDIEVNYESIIRDETQAYPRSRITFPLFRSLPSGFRISSNRVTRTYSRSGFRLSCARKAGAFRHNNS